MFQTTNQLYNNFNIHLNESSRVTTCPLLWSQISLKERLKALEHVLHRADVLKQRVTHCSSWSWLLSFIRSPVKIKGWNSWNRNRLEKKWKGKAIDPFCSILLLSSPFHFLFSSFPFPWAESCLKARLSKRNVVAAKLWLPVPRSLRRYAWWCQQWGVMPPVPLKNPPIDPKCGLGSTWRRAPATMRTIGDPSAQASKRRRLLRASSVLSACEQHTDSMTILWYFITNIFHPSGVPWIWVYSIASVTTSKPTIAPKGRGTWMRTWQCQTLAKRLSPQIMLVSSIATCWHLNTDPICGVCKGKNTCLRLLYFRNRCLWHGLVFPKNRSWSSATVCFCVCLTSLSSQHSWGLFDNTLIWAVFKRYTS